MSSQIHHRLSFLLPLPLLHAIRAYWIVRVNGVSTLIELTVSCRIISLTVTSRVRNFSVHSIPANRSDSNPVDQLRGKFTIQSPVSDYFDNILRSLGIIHLQLGKHDITSPSVCDHSRPSQWTGNMSILCASTSLMLRTYAPILHRTERRLEIRAVSHCGSAREQSLFLWASFAWRNGLFYTVRCSSSPQPGKMTLVAAW